MRALVPDVCGHDEHSGTVDVLLPIAAGGRPDTSGLQSEPSSGFGDRRVVRAAHPLRHEPALDRRAGDREGTVEILGRLALDRQATLTTETLAKATLAQIVRS